MAVEDINPWVRSEQELYSPETEELISDGNKEEYHRILRQLAHTKEIANLALEQVYLAEQEREAFFDRMQIPKAEIINLGYYREPPDAA